MQGKTYMPKYKHDILREKSKQYRRRYLLHKYLRTQEANVDGNERKLVFETDLCKKYMDKFKNQTGYDKSEENKNNALDDINEDEESFITKNFADLDQEIK